MATIGNWFYKIVANNEVSDPIEWESADDLLSIPGVVAWDVGFVNQFIYRLNVRIAMERMLGRSWNAVLFIRPFAAGEDRVERVDGGVGHSFGGDFLYLMLKVLKTIGGNPEHFYSETCGVWAKGEYVSGDWFRATTDQVSIGPDSSDWSETRASMIYLNGVYTHGVGYVWPVKVFCELRKIIDATAKMAVSIGPQSFWRGENTADIYCDGTACSLIVSDKAYDPDKTQSVSPNFPLSYEQIDPDPYWDIYPIPTGGGIIQFAGYRCAAMKITNPAAKLNAPGIPIVATAIPYVYGSRLYELDDYYAGSEAETELQYYNPYGSSALNLGPTEKASIAMAPYFGTDVLSYGDASSRGMYGLLRLNADDAATEIPDEDLYLAYE